MTQTLRRLGATTALLLCVAVPMQPASAQDHSSPDALRILERASERYQALTSFCADFRQEVEVTLLQRTTRSAGELCQSRPDRFEMRFTDPDGDRIVTDGTHLWVYFPSTDPGQVFRTRLAATEGRFDLHQEFLSEPGRRYAAEHLGTEEVDGRLTDVLDLVPRTPSPYVRARVWIDRSESLIRKIRIHEESESVRTVTLSRHRANLDLPASRFHFEPPPGVQVISR